MNHNSIHSFIDRTKKLFTSSWQNILIPFVVVLFVFLGIFSLRAKLPYSPDVLTVDPMQTADLPFYFGFFSDLGVILMASASVVNFLGASLLGRNHPRFHFLIISGIFALGLALDDLFMFHDRVLPKHLHVPEGVSYLGYFLIMIVYLLYFWHDIYPFTNYTLMVFALAAFGASMIISYLDYSFPKDGAKFLGIIYLFSYYFNSTKNFIQNETFRKKSV